MPEDQFTKLFKYMQDEFAKVHSELGDKASIAQVDRLYTLVDKHIKQQETDDQERQAMGHQLTRQESWIKQLARSTKD